MKPRLTERPASRQGLVVCVVQIESVEAFIDDVSIGKAELAGSAMTSGAAPDYPNARFSGFTSRPISAACAGRKTITVRASAAGVAQEALAQVVIPRMTAKAAVSDPASNIIVTRSI